jgi:hypothetical protein
MDCLDGQDHTTRCRGMSSVHLTFDAFRDIVTTCPRNTNCSACISGDDEKHTASACANVNRTGIVGGPIR